MIERAKVEQPRRADRRRPQLVGVRCAARSVQGLRQGDRQGLARRRVRRHVGDLAEQRRAADGQKQLDDLKAARPHLHYVDGRYRGYYIVDLTRERLQADYYAVATVPKRSAKERFEQGFITESGRNHLVTASSPPANCKPRRGSPRQAEHRTGLSRRSLAVSPGEGGPYNSWETMNRTDTSDPNYYHRVVDCQWACPAHTNVPEYIRMIAQGRFDDAYILNRESNVFPGILGRTCDRPCEPACRRTRVDGKPVAICRLKRVAADHKDDITHRLPKPPAAKNGKKVALIGAGPAALTVANDLMPLGYQCTIFEKQPRPGGLMRINIPAFRLPEEVLDEEIGYIVNMGVDDEIQLAGHEPEVAGRLEGVRRHLRRQRRAERQGARAARPPRDRSDLHRHRVARVDPLRPHRRRSASAC